MGARERNLINRIEINPRVLVGKPVIKGTRIAVEHVMRMLAAGMTPEEVIAEFPHLTRKDIQAAVFYASELVQDMRAYPQGFAHRIKVGR